MMMGQFQKNCKLRINNKILYLLLISFFSFSQNEKESELFTVFYNVENLFDTIDCPEKNDAEFLPNGKKKWDTKKYNQKLIQLNKVFSSINDGKSIDIIGLCEIENSTVINDLLNTDFFKKNNYQIIHQESPDSRGIDCALLFNQKSVLLKYDFIEVKLENATRATRDIVYAKLEINNEIIHVFVNHWPSRWGGKEKTESKRIGTAQILRDYIDEKINKKNERILIMGDFNDYPSDLSLSKTLKAKNKVSKLKNQTLFNLMSTLESEKQGSYNYKGEWGFLDQIIISSNLINNSKGCKIDSYGVFNEEWLLHKRYGDIYPNRMYLGNEWQPLGFSDHLPVYCIIKFKK